MSGGPNKVRDGMVLPGTNGSHGKRREQHLARFVNRVFEMREQGMTKREIREALHTSEAKIEAVLHDPDHVRRRLTRYNEQLRACSPLALKTIRETLSSDAPNMLSERNKVAMWVLESTKTVGKESPVNIFIKGGDTNITMSNDTLEAARAVAAAMKAAPLALPSANVIDAEVIEQTEENSNEQRGVNVGIVASEVGGGDTDQQ